jgi:hypothetical protein
MMAASMIAGVFAMMAFSQSDDLIRQVMDLRRQVADLGLRVAQLEHAGGVTNMATDSTKVTPAAAARSMVLVSINVLKGDGGDEEEIAQLQRECAALMNTVNAAADETAADVGAPTYVAHARGGVRGWGGRAGGGVMTSNVGSRGREVLADHAVTRRYANEHAIKQHQLEALQAAASEPRQLVMGHDGETIVTLETKHNLTAKLNEIAIGDVVTWTGTRLKADSTSEMWKIDTINKVQN